MSHRVVITGVGILSSIGNTFDEITMNLKSGKSGVVYMPEWEALGIKSCIAGKLNNVDSKIASSGISKKILNCMSEAAVYCTLAAQDALKDAQLLDICEGRNIASIVGSGVSSTETIYAGADLIFNNNIKRISPYTITKSMSSSCSAAITNTFKLTGRSYSISSACATSTHNIGHAYELIKSGLINMAIAGGGEEVSPIMAGGFMAMRMALSTAFVSTPESASRPYDKDRDGFIMSGGAGILVLETLESALNRNAKIYGEIIGFHANADGHDMIMPEPSGEYTSQCMKNALSDANITTSEVDYINTHGTSTIIGDVAELRAIQKVFGNNSPYISSTKSMTGHPIAAAGGIESIFCLSMLRDQYIAPSINIGELSDECKNLPIVTKCIQKNLNIVLNNNFGFGGTNATILFKKYTN